MATNKINDGVGKKIVEALKMQTPDTAQSVNTDEIMSEEAATGTFETSQIEADSVNSRIETSQFSSGSDEDFESVPSVQEAPQIPSSIQLKIQAQLQEQAQQAQYQSVMQSSPSNQSFIDSAFAQSLAQNTGINQFNQVQDDFNYPANVAVLKQLIAKLPTGVSRQTGAIIIKQTMEALGISMQSVIQEAQQVKEALNTNARECQASIVEYRKQIGILEAKSQQYQRQYAVMNDIISLFIQTGSN